MSLVFHLLLLVLLPVAWWWWWCSPRLPADPILWGRKAAATAAWALKYAIREAAIMWWWSALNGVEVYKDGVTAETAAPLCLSRSELLLRPSSSWIANGDRWGSVCEELVVLLRLSAPGALTWIVVSGRGMVAVSRFIIRKLATGLVCGFFSLSLSSPPEWVAYSSHYKHMILHVDGVGIVMSAHVWSSAFVLMRIQTLSTTHTDYWLHTVFPYDNFILGHLS